MQSEKADELERETFAFSPLKPILFVIAAPAIYLFFLGSINQFILQNSILGFIMVLGVALLIWPSIKVTFLMLALRPAVILTNKDITVTSTGYIIEWTDVKDVYMTNSGSDNVIPLKTYYITIVVRDPEKYLRKIRNPFTRLYRWITRKWRPSPFEVDLSLVRGDEDELFHVVLRYYQNNRGF